MEVNEPKAQYGKHLLTPLSEWKHVATGGVYIVIGLAMCSTNGPREHAEESVVYWSKHYQALRYREAAEFLDGRFVPLDGDGNERRFGRA